MKDLCSALSFNEAWEQHLVDVFMTWVHTVQSTLSPCGGFRVL